MVVVDGVVLKGSSGGQAEVKLFAERIPAVQSLGTGWYGFGNLAIRPSHLLDSISHNVGH